MELYHKPAAELSAQLAQGELTSEALMQAFIDRAESVDGTVGAFLHRDPEAALAEARASDERRAKGQPLGPLDGIPVGIKDVIAVKDQPLTSASKMLEKFVSPYNATVTDKLRGAGAIPWGRLNLDEYAMGSSCENSAYQKTSNPWNPNCVAGGSSGGSAACVASGGAPFALGSDTGGSIRQPAAFCGIVGMKPTYGLVSRFGLAAFASSLDQIGPMTHTIEDAALLLQAVAGHDERDSTSFKVEIPDYAAELKKPEEKWTLGVPSEYFGEGLGPDIREAVEKAIKFYESHGCAIEEISLPHMELSVPVYYILAPAEASSNLARYDGVRYTHRSEKASDTVDLYSLSRGEGFGPEVKRRVILGTYVLSSGYYDAYYLRAQKVRTLIRQDFLNAFKKVDAILAPTTPNAAFEFGAMKADPLAMYLQDIYTISVNLAGLPALSMPCGFTGNGLPIGLQVMGQPWKEAELFRIAHFFEQAHDFAGKRAEI